MENRTQDYLSAIDDFYRARRRANIERLLSFLTGRSADLLDYEKVRHQLHGHELPAKIFKSIPLDAIVGSVDRYQDFTRSFLPLLEDDKGRWTQVELAVTSLKGVPPIEVYQIGEVYFVRDGHHRVSVARQSDVTHIDANVTLVKTKVPLTADDQPIDLIIKSELSDFLDETGLDESRPQSKFKVTQPYQYGWLLGQIEAVRQRLDQDTSLKEAAVIWHDQLYRPTVDYINRRGLLREFPKRTRADLFIWIFKRREALIEQWGLEIEPYAVAVDLVAQHSVRTQRVGQKVAEAVIPRVVQEGPPAGQWRLDRPLTGDTRLFRNILVALDGTDACWDAFTQAVHLARRENGQIIGLHVVASKEKKADPAAAALQQTFDQRCSEAEIKGHFLVETGVIVDKICAVARFLDLVILSLSHPPGPSAVARLGSGVSQLIRRCPRPILAVPSTPTRPNRLLLAYDGHPKAKEALYIATYMAGQWGSDLQVLCINAPEAAAEAGRYLGERGVIGTIIKQKGKKVGEMIMTFARENDIDLILSGGYSAKSWRSIVLGSTVDEVLRTRNRPVLICR